MQNSLVCFLILSSILELPTGKWNIYIFPKKCLIEGNWIQLLEWLFAQINQTPAEISSESFKNQLSSHPPSVNATISSESASQIIEDCTELQIVHLPFMLIQQNSQILTCVVIWKYERIYMGTSVLPCKSAKCIT